MQLAASSLEAACTGVSRTLAPVLARRVQYDWGDVLVKGRRLVPRSGGDDQAVVGQRSFRCLEASGTRRLLAGAQDARVLMQGLSRLVLAGVVVSAKKIIEKTDI